MKKKIVLGFGALGLFMALVLGAMRLFMLYHEAQYSDVLYGASFTYTTLLFWPGSFYLMVLQGEEPPLVGVVVWTIAILVNPAIYAFVGWLISKAIGATKNE
jgi:hypothetical protein